MHLLFRLRTPARICRAVIGLGFLGCLGTTPASDAPQEGQVLLTSLRAELKLVRPFPARLESSGEMTACSSTYPADEDSSRPCRIEVRHPSKKIAGLASLASARIRMDGDPSALHAAALVDLLWADDGRISIDRSINYLERAADLSDDPTSVLSDLSGALIVRFQRFGETEDLLAAIEAASQSLEKIEALPTAQFNLALSLEMLGLVEQPIRAWTEYLRRDSTSDWAAEAQSRRSRLIAVENRSADRHISELNSLDSTAARVVVEAGQARLFVLNELLAEWANAHLAGDFDTAAARLLTAEMVGAELVSRGGDRSVADAVHAIRSASGSVVSSRILAESHVRYARAVDAFEKSDYEAVISHSSMRAEVRDLSPVLWLWLRFQRGRAVVQSGPPASQLRAFEELLASADAQRYPALVGRLRWASGTVLLRLGRYEESVAALRDARRMFRVAGEREHEGAVLYLQASGSLSLGRQRAAFELFFSSLAELRHFRRSIWLHNALTVFSQAATLREYRYSARFIQSEDVAVARSTGDSLNLTEAIISRARRSAELGDRRAAGVDLESALSLAKHLGDGVGAEWVRADLALAEGEVLLEIDANAAEGRLSSGLEFFRRVQLPFRVLPALIARAEARRRLGDLGGAETDLLSAVRGIERQRVATKDLSLRATLLDHARQAYDRLAMLLLTSGRAEEALEVIERGRPSFRSNTLGSMLPSAQWRDTSKALVLDYSRIADTLVIWSIRGRSVSATMQEVDSVQFSRTLIAIRALMELGTEERALRSHLSSLFDWLIRPVASDLMASDSILTIVADGEIADAPFAAAWDTANGHYLVEHHALRIAGNLGDLEQPTTRTVARDIVLIVADPAPDPSLSSSLPPLPYAREEALSIASLYGDLQPIMGTAATTVRVAELLRAATIFHFAGHTVFDQVQPERSELVLAFAPGVGSSALGAKAIREMNLGGLRLAVLSSCETGRKGSGRASGFLGLVGSFLAAGTDGVVGSLWRARDEPTSAFMKAFHHTYRHRRGAAAALRETQLSFIRSDDPTLRSPSSWAGFVYSGN